MSNRLELFDAWAADYDAGVTSEEGFPFAGYEAVLGRVVQRAAPQPAPSEPPQSQPTLRVLDLGTGTGNLAARFAALSAEVWGLDFSSQMLAEARENVPNATFLQADLLGDWPTLPQFDRIVSSYLLHEFDLSAKAVHPDPVRSTSQTRREDSRCRHRFSDDRHSRGGARAVARRLGRRGTLLGSGRGAGGVRGGGLFGKF